MSPAPTRVTMTAISRNIRESHDPPEKKSRLATGGRGSATAKTTVLFKAPETEEASTPATIVKSSAIRIVVSRGTCLM